MYNCDQCGTTTSPKDKMFKEVITKPKTYKNIRYEFDKKTRRKVKVEFKTQGFEPAKEIKLCKDCAF